MDSVVARGVWSAKGPDVSLEAFFRHHYASAVNLAAAILRDRTEAEDVVQDVFVRLAATGPKIEDPPAWLRRAVVNAALNRLRTLSRRRTHERRAGDPAGSSPGADEAVAAGESAQEVRRALARLPKRQAAVLVLRHTGLSYGEVARAAGVPADQVGTMLRRAEKRLREEMSHEPS